MMATTTRTHIRWLIQRDMPAIEWITGKPTDDLIDLLRERTVIGMVVEDMTRVDDYWGTGRVVGYMVFELGKTIIRVRHFAVHPTERRKRYGQAMAEKLVSKLSPHRRIRLAARVPAEALAAQMFFKAMGWRAVRIINAGEENEEYHMVYRLRGDDGGNR